MSAPDERDGLAGIDNLTPFEYALAGVVPADGHDSPSLTVIDDMRRLADEMVDAPGTQARLRDFLETGGALARHDDRPGSTRRRGAHPGPAVAGAEISTGARTSAEVRSRTEGRFVDITPIELTQPVPSLEPTGEPAVVAGSEAVTAERSEIDRIRDALRSVIDTGPATGDSPAPEVGPAPGVEQEPEVPSPAKTETGPATSSPAPPCGLLYQVQ